MTTYTPPSQCWQCVPIETVTTQSATTWTVDLAHEPTCPNNPKERSE
jgi:hypothetical protein